MCLREREREAAFSSSELFRLPAHPSYQKSILINREGQKDTRFCSILYEGSSTFLFHGKEENVSQPKYKGQDDILLLAQ